ncbi:AAA family ATPase [Arthrobacter gandavensis]|uniref:LuxR C-terminal-related transcriptional regulator n=1 Tax=Arthrobacter gandavensis TaxID=169960 RepID=UPI00188ED994|nr:LuxR family transcriptional regulator [Arthrobacter gandavensis]MBF4993021.1 AAA family ATPase [Arthrobacter gandavensis]
MEKHHSSGACSPEARTTGSTPAPVGHGHDSPFLGRAALVRSLAECLNPDSPASGCLIIGEAGSGKSALMRHVLELYGQDAYTVNVRGSAFAGRTAFGALTFLLSELDPETVSHPVLILRGLSELIRERAQGRQIILAVDNAEELDEFSAMVLSQMVANRLAHMFAAFRDFSAAPAEFMGLWREGLLSRLDLEPMLPSECAHLLEAELRGPVSRAAAEDLIRISGGNPSLLLCAAADYRESGRVRAVDGVWVLDRGQDCAFPRLASVMGTKLAGLTDDQRDLLDLLALAGALPLGRVLEQVESRQVDALQESGLLQLVHRTVPALSLVDSGLGRVLLGQIDPGRRRELLEKLPPDPVVSWPAHAARWLLSAGVKLPAELALAAGRTANAEGDPGAAEEFITADPNYLSSPCAVLELARAVLAGGDAAGASDVVARHRAFGESGIRSPETVRLLIVEAEAGCRRMAEQQFVGGCTAQAHGARLEEAGEILAALAADGLARGESAQLERELVLARARCLVQHGQYGQAASFLAGVYARGDENGRGFRTLVGSWLCVGWGMTDRQSDALELASALWPLLTDAPEPDFDPGEAAQAQARILHVLMVAGALDSAGEFLARAAVTEGAGSIGGTLHEVCEGVLHAFAGRGAAATTRLLPAARQLAISDPGGLLHTVSAVAAYSAALQGQHQLAEEHLRTADSVPVTPSWALQRTAAHFTVLARNLLGSEEAGETLAAMAVRDEDRGAGAYAVLSLLSAVRLGDRDQAQQLLDAASGLQGRFARLCEDYAKGAASCDPQLLLRAADAAAALGHELLSRETGERALQIAAGAGDRATVRFIHRTRRAQSGESENDAEVEDCLRGLTGRERVIARQAAAGTSNKMIAAELSISVRTVEGHLYQIYSKLHVGSRRELAKLLTAGQMTSGSQPNATQGARR